MEVLALNQISSAANPITISHLSVYTWVTILGITLHDGTRTSGTWLANGDYRWCT